ncbi:MAG: FAD-dependent oxidoreductase, partial [Chloroflexi bacterium]|nr:FAD-dependent oxidoreductase [Chloroflexota bacterium]
GKDIEIAFDELLIGTGKTPNTAGLGLEKAGVVLSNGGAIKVNAYYQTNAPHIYAVGDAADLPKRLETTAGKEGSFAALNVITGVNKSKLDYALVPSVVFTDPAVADVGLLDEEVPAHGLRCMCGTVYLNKLPKSRVIKDPRGAIKMVAEEKSGRIAGIHILAPHAEELINAAMYIVRARMTIDDVIDSLTVFPTMSEAIKLAALSFRTDIDRISCCI